MTTRPSVSAILAIRAPLAAPGLQYRAYEEEWEFGSALDWIFARLRARAPAGVPVVCVCESPAERERLTAAHHSPDGTQILCLNTRGDRHLCRLLIDRLGVGRLMVAGFSHAVAPLDMMRHVFLVHTALNAELSDITRATFREPLYVIESTLLDEMESILLPDVPEATIPAAELLRAARARDIRLARDFLWARIDVAKCFGLTAEQWPEQIAIRRRTDVAILRQAWSDTSAAEGTGGLVTAWKRAAISLSESTNVGSRPVSKRAASRVRVLYASHLPGFTGAHQSICHLIGALDRQRYEPIALVSHEGTFTQELRRRNVTVICPERNIAEPGIQSFRYALQVMTDQRPDILHAQHFVGMGVICAAVAAGVQIIQHVRVPNVSTLGHHVHAADAVIAVSAYIRQRLAELDIDPAKVEVVLNGVDTATFKPDPAARPIAREQFKIPQDDFVVLIIARMMRKKRHDVVVKAVARLRRAIGRGHLVMVGARESDHAYHHQVQTLVATEGLADHVTKIEFVADIRPVLHACDVLALPSEEEPLSRAVLDAMAVGLPAIVSDSGGSKEVIDHGRTGIVLPRGDDAQLANALVTLAESGVLRLAMGAAAVDKIQRSLTASHCAAKTALIYERLLRGEYRTLDSSAQPQ